MYNNIFSKITGSYQLLMLQTSLQKKGIHFARKDTEYTRMTGIRLSLSFSRTKIHFIQTN